MGRGQWNHSLSGRSQRTAKRLLSNAPQSAMSVDGEQLSVINDVNNLPVQGKRRLLLVRDDDGTPRADLGYVEGNIGFVRAQGFQTVAERDVRPGSAFNENEWHVVHVPTGKILGSAQEGLFTDPQSGASYGGWRLNSMRREIAPKLNKELTDKGRPKRGADLQTVLDDVLFGNVFAGRDQSTSNLDFLFGGVGSDAVPF